MACLGDASRFRLVAVLAGGPRCVTELAAEVGLSQSCTTRHLQALERQRVIAGKRDGKRVMYRLRREEPGLDPLLVWALRSRAGSGRRGGGSQARTATHPSPALHRVGLVDGPEAEPEPGPAGDPPIPSHRAPGDGEPAVPEPGDPPPRGRARSTDMEDYLL